MLAAALCSAPAAVPEPDPIYLRFEVFGGPGLHFLTLQVSVEQSSGRYALAADAETRNLVDLFLDLHTRIDYAADGAVTAEATPPSAGPVTPVSPAQMRGTVDQLTAYLELARHLATRGSCALALAVFDGRRRYDLSFTDVAPEALPDFTGPLQVCEMWRRRVAGFPIDRGGDQRTDEGKLWFARLIPADFMIPVRMEFGSEFGAVTANLTELRGRGAALKFPE